MLERYAEIFPLIPAVPVSLRSFGDPVQRQRWIDEKGMVVFQLRAPDVGGSA